MARVAIFFMVIPFFLWGSEQSAPLSLEKECLQCHIAQKIPSGAIYRRYLLRYSSKDLIRKKIFSYLKDPTAERSIMPPQFFGKFPIKEASHLNDATLRILIDAYIDHYDVDKRLYVVPAEN